MMMLIFHGYLKEFFPNGRLEVAASSAAEAISALEGRLGFRREDGDRHHVVLPDFQSRDALFATTDRTEIHLVPALEGAGGRPGVMQIVIGAAMIYFSGGLASAYLGAGASAASVAALSGSIALTGAMMVLGGVLQMLMPQPTIKDSNGQDRSNYLPANKNTVAIGTPIPLLIGKRRVYGQFLSFDIDAKDRAAMGVPTLAQTLARVFKG